MAIRDEVLKELLEGYKKPEDLLGPEGLLKQLTAALVGKALSAEMTEHLGYEKHEPAGRGSGNSRNGTSDKTLKTESGEMPTDVLAEAALTAFEASAFGVRYPMIGKSWRANWQRVIPFLAFPREIRKVIYTTNAIESLNYSLRKIIKTRGHFPSEEAATKLLYLALIRAEQRWTMPIWRWKDALNQFAVHFDGRLSI
jgi:transposase-like protein